MDVRRGDGGHDDREEDEAKMGFIFQINEACLWYSITRRKGTKEGA